MSLAINLLVLLAAALACAGFSFLLGGAGEDATRALTEHYHSGRKSADDKVAVVRIDGVLMEGLTGFAERQIDQAAADTKVKAVVVRINSPGGSITASDQLHRRLALLRAGDPAKQTPAKPVVVSMASIAASGGYYIAMPAATVYAERTTITGSIGVYAALPDVKGLADKIGVKLTLIKKGDLKASGSPFRDLTPEEHEEWQDMIDHAYDQFKEVVAQGRKGKLKAGLEANVIDEPRKVEVEEEKQGPGGKNEVRRVEKTIRYVRKLADGGIYTADKALEFGLIDRVGYLDDAIHDAAGQAGLGDNFKAITYKRPFSLEEVLLGVKAPEPGLELDASGLANGLTPRLWYLAPQAELAGWLQASRRGANSR
jgi:protease-4